MGGTAIGIDFGHAHIKLVELHRRRRQVQLKRATLIPIPQGALRKGAVAQPDVLEEALAGASPGLRLDRAVVVAGITGPQLGIRAISLEVDPEEDVELAMRQELAATMRLEPAEMEEYCFDYHLLPSSRAARHELVAVAVKYEVVAAFTGLLREVRLAAHALDVEAFALPRALPLDGPACYIEIGADYTQILVTSGGQYLVYRLIPVGMGRLTAAVSAAYDLSPAGANALRARTHIDKLVVEAPGDRTNLQRILQEIAGGLLQTLEFLRARQRVSDISELLSSALLCGGGAVQPGMTQLLSEELGLPVEVGHPLSVLPGAADLPNTTLAIEPIFAGAVGLALRGVEAL